MQHSYVLVHIDFYFIPDVIMVMDSKLGD